MQTFHELLAATPQIEERLHYAFQDRALLALAFVHRSFVNETQELKEHNERLEFLGDSVLGVIVSDYLFRMLPSMPEGDLSFLRSRLVEAPSCVTYVQKLKVEKFLLLGKGERMSEGRGRGSILADLFEALVGAIYLDGGLEAAKRFLFTHFSAEIDATVKMPISNWKAMLQDFCQKSYQQTPVYEVISESGPDHNKRYRIKVSIQEGELGQGEGNSKKAAQQAAAQDAMRKYGN